MVEKTFSCSFSFRLFQEEPYLVMLSYVRLILTGFMNKSRSEYWWQGLVSLKKETYFAVNSAMQINLFLYIRMFNFKAKECPLTFAVIKGPGMTSGITFETSKVLLSEFVLWVTNGWGLKNSFHNHTNFGSKNYSGMANHTKMESWHVSR